MQYQAEDSCQADATRVKEWYDGRLERTWSSTLIESRSERKNVVTNSLRQYFFAAFVPTDSTTEDYVRFQIWDSIQGLCSYIRGMLSTQAILKGILTEQTPSQSTAGSAVFTYFMRDFSGMLGGVIFAAAQGSGMDSYAKQWRIFADCFNNVGYVLELISPLFPAAFLYLACLGSVARAITGVAAGATRSALTYHFARDGNAGDIAAKEGSQETAVTLVGMSLGMIMVNYAGGSHLVTWIAFLLLTALHIYANMKAMRSLLLTNINRPRLDLIIQTYFKNKTILSVADVAQREDLYAPPLRAWVNRLMHREDVQIILGAAYTDLEEAGREALLNSKSAPYFCWPQAPHRVLVILKPAINKIQILQAYAEAWSIAKDRQEANNFDDWTTFLAKAENAGWEFNNAALGEGKWRVLWGSEAHEE